MENNVVGKSIIEVSNRYNLSSRTLRFYEYKGIIAPVRIGVSRFYMPKDIIRLELILKAKKFGFSLEEIRLLTLDPTLFNLPLKAADFLGRNSKWPRQPDARRPSS